MFANIPNGILINLFSSLMLYNSQKSSHQNQLIESKTKNTLWRPSSNNGFKERHYCAILFVKGIFEGNILQIIGALISPVLWTLQNLYAGLHYHMFIIRQNVSVY